MKVVMAGASGFLGTAWRDHLARQGHDVVRLVRGPAMSDRESHWDPFAGQVDRAAIEDADVVANLAGSPLAHWPYSKSYQRTFKRSRVATTRTLAEAIAASDRKPALLQQIGTAHYGDHGDAPITEATPTDADTFMADVCQGWEAATEPAQRAGARVVLMRSSPVLGRGGGAFKPIRLIFAAGLGAPVGSGDQYFPTISLPDWARAATSLAEDDAASGAFNLAAPNPSTNAEFGRALARMLHRPFVMKVPAWPVRKLLGAVSSEVLGSQRIVPERLVSEGFSFDHPTLEDRIAAALNS
jgi:uncharacterized protein (TIGR01777 family)